MASRATFRFDTEWWCSRMPNLNKEALMNQLISMRAAIDAALSILAQEDQCQHARKESKATFGSAPKWRCLDCGEEWTEG